MADANDNSLADAMADAQPMEDYLDLGLEETQELIAVDDGEYRFNVTSARRGRKNEASQEYLLVRLELSDIPEAKDVTHVMMLPDPTRESTKEVNKRRLSILSFYEAVGLDRTSKPKPEELVGLEGWAYLKQEDNPEYGLQNKVSYFIKPQ